MTEEQKKIVERFCEELTKFDAWSWRTTCRHILNEIDYSAPARVIDNGRYYSFEGVMKDGQTIRAGHQDGGFYIDWGKPVQGLLEEQNVLSFLR